MFVIWLHFYYRKTVTSIQTAITWVSVKRELKCFSSWIPRNWNDRKKNIVNAALERWVASLCCSSTLMRRARSVVYAVLEGWMVFQQHVTTPISAQCHSCKQSHGSVLADLTKSALPATKKNVWNCFWLVSRPHLGCLLDFPATLVLTCCIWLIISFGAIILRQPGCPQQCIHNRFVLMFFQCLLIMSPI